MSANVQFTPSENIRLLLYLNIYSPCAHPFSFHNSPCKGRGVVVVLACLMNEKAELVVQFLNRIWNSLEQELMLHQQLTAEIRCQINDTDAPVCLHVMLYESYGDKYLCSQ